MPVGGKGRRRGFVVLEQGHLAGVGEVAQGSLFF